MKIQLSLSSAPLDVVKMMTRVMPHIHKDIKEVAVDTKIHSRAKQKDCFNNAWRHVDDDPTDVYVLGYVFVYGIPIEHAWIRQGGKYYDVTLDATKQDCYIAVTEIPTKDLRQFVYTQEHAPDLYRYEVMLRKQKK